MKKLGKPSDIIKLVFDLVGLLKMEKMVKTETAEITMGIGKEKRTFGFIKDSFKNMQGGMLADSSFLKNIFYFSKYEKDMINDETIEFMRDSASYDVFTPSTRLVSIREDAGWFLF